MYVNGMGFVMAFDLSGGIIEYTTVVAQAQRFDTRGQVRGIMLANDIGEHKVFAVEIGAPITK
jgi:hypothetical protein